MKKFLYFVFLIGCSSPDNSSKKPKELYGKGMFSLKNGDYKDASQAFLDIDRFHPEDTLASRAQLLSGYASFMARDYNDAIDAFSIFTRLYPLDPHADYAYYMIGMCYYAQTQHIERDHTVIEKAGQSFEDLIEKFPHSVYTKDARLKMDYIRSHLAGKEMTIGRYYQSENNSIAALKRFNEVVAHYSKTSHVPEALYRIIECQVSLGLKDEAQKTLKILKINFSKNSWYKKAVFFLHSTFS